MQITFPLGRAQASGGQDAAQAGPSRTGFRQHGNRRRIGEHQPGRRDQARGLQVGRLRRRPGAAWTDHAIGAFFGPSRVQLAGQVAALLAIENVTVSVGKLVVIPYANRSAITVPDTRNGVPAELHIVSRSGPRVLPYGDRRTDPADQGVEDPERYTNPPGYTLEECDELYGDAIERPIVGRSASALRPPRARMSTAGSSRA